MLRSSACYYILLKGTIKITRTGADTAGRQLGKRNKQVTFKNCAPFTDCTNQINKIQLDNAKDPDVVMLIYNLMHYCDIYVKTSKSLWPPSKMIQMIT